MKNMLNQIQDIIDLLKKERFCRTQRLSKGWPLGSEAALVIHIVGC